MSCDQVILVAIPLEIAWKATVSWWADWLTCKVMVSLRIFGYFLTSNVLMAISMDRWHAAHLAPVCHHVSRVQVQRHGVPDLPPRGLAPHAAAAGGGLGPGGALLHPSVSRLQPPDSPRGAVLQVPGGF